MGAGQDVEFDLDALRRSIDDLDITQQEIADALGIDRSAVSRALAGKRRFYGGEKAAMSLLLANKLAARTELLNRSKNGKDVNVTAPPALAASELGDDGLSAYSGVTIGPDGTIADWYEPEQLRGAGRADLEQRRIPVYAAPQPVGDDGSGESGNLFDWQLRQVSTRPVPAPLVGVMHAYGIYAPLWGWGPRFRPGDVVFFHPFKVAGIGDFALVAWAKSFLTVGEVLSIDQESIVVRVDGVNVRVKRGELTLFHRAVGIWFE